MSTLKRDRERLVRAVLGNNLADLSAVLADGVSVNVRDEDGLTALHYAALADTSREIATVLVRAGASVNATSDRGETPLDYARRRARRGDAGVFDFLQHEQQASFSPRAPAAHMHSALH